MTVHVREPVKFDAIEIDLNKSWTAQPLSKGGGHMNILSNSRSTDRIKWDIRGNYEKAFQPDEYWSAENHLKKKFQHEKARTHIMNAQGLNSKLIMRERMRSAFKNQAKSFFAWGTFATIILILGISYLTLEKLIPFDIGGPMVCGLILVSVSSIRWENMRL